MSLSHSNDAVSKPTRIPATTAIANPMMNSSKLTIMFFCRSPLAHRSPIAAIEAIGVAKNSEFFTTKTPMNCQIARPTITDPQVYAARATLRRSAAR